MSLLLALSLAAAPTSVGVTLLPAQHKLLAMARYHGVSEGPGEATLKFRLDAGLRVTRVVMGKRVLAAKRDGDRLEVRLPAATRAGQPWQLEIDYAGRPLARDGDQVTQDVAPEGVLLAPGGAWYPELADAPSTAISATVRAPLGWRASGPVMRAQVAAGKAALRMDFAAGTKPAIAAGPYKIYSANGVTCSMLGKPPEGGSLTRGAALLAFYQAHGVTAASGPHVLAELPAHFASAGTGNWLAAPRPTGALGDWLASLTWLPHAGVGTGHGQLWLTHSLVAYTSALLAEKEHGHAALVADLRQRLANYEGFVRRTPALDLPLGGTLTPELPAWEPVVLDKGVLLWALVHDELGDKAFWAMLAARHESLAKGDASLETFLALAGRRLDFVQDWLARPGLPRYRLEDVHVTGQPGAYQVTGTLAQPAGTFRTPLDLALITDGGVSRLAFQSFDARVPFHFTSATKPLRLVIDPAERLPLSRLHRLWIREGLASPDLVIVYGTRAPAAEVAANKDAAQTIAQQLRSHTGELPVIADTAVTASVRRGALVLVGRPASNALSTAWEDQLPVRVLPGETPALWWQGRTYQRPHQGCLEAIANPEAPEHPVVLVTAVTPAALAEAARFYDRQATYCIYDGKQILEEGEALRTFPDLEAVLY